MVVIIIITILMIIIDIVITVVIIATIFLSVLYKIHINEFIIITIAILATKIIIKQEKKEKNCIAIITTTSEKQLSIRKTIYNEFDIRIAKTMSGFAFCLSYFDYKKQALG